MNGSTDDILNESLSSITKLGSWLALSILNEGIFNSFPATRNKFIKLIKPLFEISQNKKHEDISKLPKYIIDNWVLNYLNESIDGNSQKITSWYIAASLANINENCKDLFIKKWPTNYVEQKQLLLFLINSKYFNDAVLARLSEFTINLAPDDIEIFSELNIEKLNKLCKYQYSKNLFSPALFEYIFLNSMREMFDEINFLKYFKIPGLIPEDSRETTLRNILKRINVVLVKGYSIELNVPVIKNHETLNSILLFSKKNNIEFVFLLCSYLKTYLFNDYCRVINYYNGLDENLKIIIKDTFPKIDPIIYDSLANNKTLEEGEFYALIDKYSNIDVHNLSLNDKAGLMEVKNITSFELIDFLDKLKEFSSVYFHKDINQISSVHIEFIKLFNSVFFHSSRGELKALIFDKEIKSSLYLAIQTAANVNLSLDFISIQSVFYIFEVSEINLLLDLYPNIFSTKTLFFERNSFRYNSNIEGVSEITRTMSDFVKFRIILKKSNIYKVFAQEIIMQLFLFKEIGSQIIPINEMLEDKTNDVYKSVLFLASPIFTDKHYSELELLLNNYTVDSDDDQIIEFLLFVLNYKTPSIFIDNVLDLLNSIIKKDHTKLRSRLENFIYNYISSKPTDIVNKYLYK